MRLHKSEINLMPLQLQQARQRGLYLSRLQRVAVAALLAAIIGGAAHAGAWWWLRQELLEAASAASDEAAGMGAAAEVVRWNALLQQVDQERQGSITWTPFLSDVFLAMPAGVQLTEVQGERETRTVTVTGVASERSAIIAFQQALEAAPWVQRVASPLSNLSIGSVNSFTFVINLRQQL